MSSVLTGLSTSNDSSRVWIQVTPTRLNVSGIATIDWLATDSLFKILLTFFYIGRLSPIISFLQFHSLYFHSSRKQEVYKVFSSTIGPLFNELCQVRADETLLVELEPAFSMVVPPVLRINHFGPGQFFRGIELNCRKTIATGIVARLYKSRVFERNDPNTIVWPGINDFRASNRMAVTPTTHFSHSEKFLQVIRTTHTLNADGPWCVIKRSTGRVLRNGNTVVSSK